jgi:Domain of unknown function (DUF4190)
VISTPPDEPSQSPAPPPTPPPAPPPQPQPPPTPPASSGGYYTQPTSSTNGLAIASLVSSIAGFVICGLGFIVGVVLGYIAKNQIDQTGGAQEGRGMAVAGIIVGWVGIGLFFLGMVIVIIVAAATS